MSKRRTFEHKDKRGRRSIHAPDLNISELCRKAELNRSTLSRILKGERGAGRKVLFGLARARRSTVEETERWLKALVAREHMIVNSDKETENG